MVDKRPFHFHNLGVTRNPFGALTPEEWAAVAILPPEIAAVVADKRWHVQLIGPMGCGKTTILHKVVDVAVQDGLNVQYEYIAQGDSQCQSALDGLDLFVLDEAQRLSWRERDRWSSGIKTSGLRTIFSSHKNLGSVFKRKKLPLRTIELHQLITLPHYESILRHRLAVFALPNRPMATFSQDAIQFLYREFRQDLREVEYFLYEVWQQLNHVEMVTAVQLAAVLREYGR